MTAFYPSDQYGYSALLSEDERQVLGWLRTVLDDDIQPLLAEPLTKGDCAGQEQEVSI